MAKVKKVFPLVPGTEIAIKYKNQFGHTVATNINSDKGLEFDKLEGDLKTQVLKAIRAGTLVVKEVEVVERKQEKDAMLKELEKIAGIKKPEEKTKEEKTIVTNKHEQKTSEKEKAETGLVAASDQNTTIHGRRRGK